MIEAAGLEAATIWTHAAGILSLLNPNELAQDRRMIVRINALTRGYDLQPLEIAAVAPVSDAELVKTALDVDWLFQTAMDIHPDAGTFRKWWVLASAGEKAERRLEDVAQKWHRKLPNDPEPLLLLSELAERRNALTYAIKYLAHAELIDPMNPRVRTARVRLILGVTWKHFKDGKAHLVEKDLEELEAIAGMKDGDRAAFLLGLRAAWHALRAEKAQAQEATDVLAARMGPISAMIVLDTIAYAAQKKGGADWPAVRGPGELDAKTVAEADARTIRLFEDVGVGRMRTLSWDVKVDEALRAQPAVLSVDALLAIARGALARTNGRQAYLATVAGLRVARAAGEARFLLLRAKALLGMWAAAGRVSQCLRAARVLARQNNDQGLIRLISEEIDAHSETRFAVESAEGSDLGAQVLADILKSEREATEFPKSAQDAERYVVLIGNSKFSAPFGEEENWDDEEDGDDDEEDDDALFGSPGSITDNELPPGIPLEAMPLMAEIIDKYGRLLTPMELMRKDPALAARLAAIFLRSGFTIDDLDRPTTGPGTAPPSTTHGGRRRRDRKKKRRR